MIPNLLNTRYLIRFGILFVACVLGTLSSQFFYTNPAIFPIHSGVALAGLVLWGLELWPAVLLGSLVANISNGGNLFIDVVVTIAVTIQASVGAAILKRFSFSSRLHRMRDWAILGAVAFLSSLIVPILGVLAFSIQTAWGGAGIPVSFAAWWVGHIVSLVVVAPFLMHWVGKPRFRRSPNKTLEILLAFFILIGLSSIIFIGGIGTAAGFSLTYLFLIPLFWIALRHGPRFTTLAIVISSIIVFGGVSIDLYGPLPVPLGQILYQLEIWVVAVSAIFFTLTAIAEERRYANEQLSAQVDRLQIALRTIQEEENARNAFVTTLVHELRNPLSPLTSSIELLGIMGPTVPDFPQVIRSMQDRVQTMRRLLDDLMDVVRISQQRFELNKKVVDVGTIVRKSVDSVSAFMQKRGHTMVASVPPENEALLLSADPVRIEQVLVNILTNAAKYTDQGGKITLSAKRAGGYAVIVIADNGIGIPEGMLSKIFEPFTQLHEGRGVGGLGIGLALTKQLVELHEGHVEARSDGEGRGSEFTIFLPLLLEEGAAVAPEAEVQQSSFIYRPFSNG